MMGTLASLSTAFLNVLPQVKQALPASPQQAEQPVTPSLTMDRFEKAAAVPQAPATASLRAGIEFTVPISKLNLPKLVATSEETFWQSCAFVKSTPGQINQLEQLLKDPNSTSILLHHRSNALNYLYSLVYSVFLELAEDSTVSKTLSKKPLINVLVDETKRTIKVRVLHEHNPHSSLSRPPAKSEQTQEQRYDAVALTYLEDFLKDDSDANVISVMPHTEEMLNEDLDIRDSEEGCRDLHPASRAPSLIHFGIN